jgi:transposase
MATRTLVPDPAVVTLEELIAEAAGITVIVRACRPEVCCPDCGRPTRRIHSRYTRHLRDLPWQGLGVTVMLHTRRWRCATPQCPRRVFTERMPTLSPPHGRRTTRLGRLVLAFGVAVGGRPGARLLAEVGIAVSGDTLRRAVVNVVLPAAATPRVLGVDDWSLRKGHTYGTIVVDLERRRPIDLLPDRSAATFAAWLAAHPGAEVICRDRGGAYADGARQGAPHAIQVADRWHLLANLGAALERAVVAQRAPLPTVPVAAPPPTESTPPLAASAHEQDRQARHARREERYRAVQRLRAQGLGYRQIANTLGLHRATVRKYVAAPACPLPAPRRGRRRGIDPFVPYLRERWAAGERRVTVLWQDLRERGFTGNYQRVAVAVAPWRDVPARTGRRPRHLGSPAPAARRSSPRQAAWWLGRPDDDLTDGQRAALAALLTAQPTLAEARTLALEFTRLMRERDGAALDPWLAAVGASGVAALRGFAEGLRRDEAAVRAALDHSWSSGQVEGQVNRLKLVKRAMFGRAGFALLRQRFLLTG